MIRKISKKFGRKANTCHIETLEDRRLMSASLKVAQSLMVFNAVKNSGTSQTETLTLTASGDQTINLGPSAFSLLDDPSVSTQDIPRFTVLNASSAPITLSPGQSFNLQLNYNAVATGINSAFLDIATNDAGNPIQQVALRGIGTAGLGGSNQPSLARILRAYNIPTIVGEGPNDSNAATDSVYPTPADPSSQEVVMQQMVKAGAGPVTIQVLASFDAAGTKPYTLGTYTPGNPDNRSELFFTPTSEYQSTYIQPQGATSFDPGTSAFGFYFVSNIKDSGKNRIGYSEDQFNTWDTTNTGTTNRKFRFFPMENADGSVVPNAYIMTSTEWQNPGGYDFTNIVAIVRNVMPATASAPIIGLQNGNALPGSNTMIFNRIQAQNVTLGDQVHDTGVLTINNTGKAALIISSYTLDAAWTLLTYPAMAPVSFPLSVAVGQSVQLALKFVAQTEPTHAFNETQFTSHPNDGGVYTGTLTLNSNDPVSPVSTVPLAGWWQARSEDDTEPSLQTIVNMMIGWKTAINATPIPDLTENIAIPSTPTYYGEETISAYWAAADTGMPVSIAQIDAYHTEGNVTNTSYFPQGGSAKALFTTATDDGQTLFPYLYGTTTPAATQFSPSGNFGFKIDGEYSDDTKNVQTGGGHHVRFFPVRDGNGNLVPNAYIMCMDYTLIPGQNFDFQDNVYIVSNIRPAALSAAPTDVYALNSAANPANVQLNWAPVQYGNLAGYNVYRSFSAASGYLLLNAAPISATNFLDTLAPTGATLYYKITAVDASTKAESLGMFSTAVTPGTPGDGFQSVDVGVTQPGSTTTVTSGTGYDIVAGGPGIGGNSDTFRYMFTAQSGNFDVMMQVESITVAGSYSTGGIMARTTLDPASPNVYMSASPANYRFKYRTTQAGTETVMSGGTTKYPLVWVRLSRVGNLFTGYMSADGVTWTKLGGITTSLPNTVYLGMAVASNSATTTTTAQLRNYVPTGTPVVPVQPGQPTTPPAPANFIAVGAQGGVSLSWSAVSYANLKGYNLYRSTSLNGTYTLFTPSPITNTSYFDSAATVGVATFYQIVAVDSTTAALSTPSFANATAQAVSQTGLQSTDIGNPSPTGSTVAITTGTDYDVFAGGPGVGGNADAFRFVYESQTGDFDVKVQVLSLSVAGSFSTAGLMARSSLDASSPEVYMSASPVNYRFKSRTTAGATAAVGTAGTTSYPNVWVRLTRVGNVFTGYYSTNGSTWTKMSSITLALPATIDLGMGVASNNNTQQTNCQLRNFGPTSTVVVQPTTPPTPGNFLATGASGGVSLTWNAVSYASLKGYNVYSSSSATGTFALLTPTPISSTSFFDSSATVGVTTFYKVTAVDSSTATESTAATANGIAQAVVIQTGLQSVDIGGVSPAGSTAIITAGSDFNVTAGGPGVGANADAFRFIYQSQTGDFDVAVQVASLTVAGNFSTAGIMARSTLDAASPEVYMAASPVNYRFKDRTSAGAAAAVASTGTTAYPNVWVRLTRVGNVFTGYFSVDGKTWTKMSSVTIALPTTIDLGLGVASNTNDTTTTAQLRSFGPTNTTPPVTGAPSTPTTLTATGSTGAVTLNWTAPAGTVSGYNVYSSTSSTGTYTLLTPSPITQTSFIDSTAPAGETMYYKVTAVGSTALESTAATTHGAAALTTALTSTDIGASQAGTTTVITPGSDFNVTAGGPGVGANADGFRFISAQQTGDFDVKVQVSSLTVAGNFSTAGIMARATMDATSTEVYMGASPVNYRFKDRTTAGSTAAIASTGTTSYPNVWVRLSRVGNVFTGYFSTDGIHWTTMSTVTIALPSTVYLGLGVASNDTADLATAQLRGYSNT